MTPLNNQELEQKTDELMKRLGWVYKPNKGGTYYWQKFNGVHKSQMTLSEARLLTELFESELANREREACKKGFIKGGIDEIIRNDKAIKEIEAQLQNNSSKGEENE